MIEWPSTMPKSLQSGFSMQPEDRRIASSTVGTSFQQGFGGDVCVAEVSLTLNRTQAAWLEKFERDTLVQGTKWFSFPVWYAGEVHDELCRFKTRPKASSVNGFHGTYQFSLYVRRRTELMPDCMVKVFACYPPCFFPKFNKKMDALYEVLQGVNTKTVADALQI